MSSTVTGVTMRISSNLPTFTSAENMAPDETRDTRFRPGHANPMTSPATGNGAPEPPRQPRTLSVRRRWINRAKTGYAKRMGHRQMHSLVEIEDVVFGKRSGTKKAEDADDVEAAPVAQDQSVGDAASSSTGAEAPAEERKPRPKPGAEGDGAARKSTRSSAGAKSRRSTKGRA